MSEEINDLKQVFATGKRPTGEDFSKLIDGLKPEVTANDIEQISTQLAENEKKLVNVAAFGAKGNANYYNQTNNKWYEDSKFTIESTDDTQAIKTAMNMSNGHIYLPFRCLISETINVPSLGHIEGAGVDVAGLMVSDDTFNAITIAPRAYRVTIKGFRIESPSINETAKNTAIKVDDAGGVQESLIENVVVWRFYYGIKAKDLYWMNTIRNVRVNLCGYSFYSDSTAGTSIGNLFDHFYSDRPTLGGVYMTAFKSVEFLNCNFGGRKGTDDVPTFAVRILNNCIGIKMTTCNVEHHIAPATGIIQTWSGSTLSIDDTNIFNCNSAPGVTGYAIVAREASRIKLTNCTVFQKGDALRGIYTLNSATVVVDSCDSFYEDVVDFSTNKTTNITKRVRDLNDQSYNLTQFVTATLQEQSLSNGVLTPLSVASLNRTTNYVSQTGTDLFLESGIYHAWAFINFDTNPTGTRMVTLHDGTNTTNSVGSVPTRLSMSNLIVVSARTKLNLSAYQVSGGNLNVLSTSTVKIQRISNI